MSIKHFLCSLLILFSVTGCASNQEKTPLVVFAAGSLIVPLDEVEKEFERLHPNIDVRTEYHGSIQVIRHSSELNEPIDVVLSADYALIPMLMYDQLEPESNQPYANWSCKFASNRMGLAYTDRSRYADEINSDNWYEVLSRKDVRVGLSDPRFDASGYRTLMIIKLAEKDYGKEGIFAQVFNGEFTQPLRDLDRDTKAIILVPEILETRTGSHIYMRGSSVQLISLLEAGDIDYAFEYESVIKQHGLREVVLPASLDLGDSAFEQVYNQVEVKLDFRRFSSVEPIFNGERIAYGATIPVNAPNPDLAAEYLAFLFGDQGREIMGRNFHPILDPIACDGYENTPNLLQELIERE